jgi:hypothetical protein
MKNNPFEKIFQQKEDKLEDSEHFPEETFESFESGKIELPVFEFSIELPEGCFFRNDKIVDSIPEHTKEVLREFNLDPEEVLSKKELESLNNTTGHNRFIEIKNNSGDIIGKFSITFILSENENRGPEFQIFNEAHEIAHAIQNLDEKAFNDFVEKIFQKTGLKVSFKDVDEETVCTIIGLLAMKMHKIPMDAFNKHQEFKDAYNVLQKLIKE